jgi:hypothetical protein
MVRDDNDMSVNNSVPKIKVINDGSSLSFQINELGKYGMVEMTSQDILFTQVSITVL